MTNFGTHIKIAPLALLALLAACPSASNPNPQPNPQPTPVITPVISPLGTPVGSPSSTTIGVAGGTLASADGAIRIEIPAGALASDQTIGIQEITNNAPSAFGKAFRLTPEGTTFAKPVKLSFQLTEDQVQSAPLETMNVAYQKDGYWMPAKIVNRDAASRTVSVETNHFSDWSGVPGVQLNPFSAHVKLGQTLNLSVEVCVDIAGGDPNNPSIFDVYACKSNVVFSHVVRNWSVNGTPGGRAASGTVSAVTPGTATYTAPAKKPSSNPVAVSVQYNNPVDGSQVTLVANVMVGDDNADWQGTITYTESGTRTWPARDGFIGSFTGKFEQNHTFTVVGVKEVDGPSTTLILKQVADSDYSYIGNKHREIYEICQALGPVVLRYYDDYTINSRLKGNVSATVEARLYRDTDGGYSMFVSGESIPVSGKEVVTDIHKNGCTHTTNDASYTKEKSFTENMAKSIEVIGTGPDPKNTNQLSGSYKGKDQHWSVDTAYSVEWKLTRVPKP